MKTVLIYGPKIHLDKNPTATFVDVLPEVFMIKIDNSDSYEKVLVIRKRDYVPTIALGVINNPYDLIINVNDVTTRYTELSPYPVRIDNNGDYISCEISRKSKSIYSHILNTAGEYHSLYHRVNCWSSHVSFIPETGKQYMIRPAGGARGQYFVKPDLNKISVEKILNSLTQNNLNRMVDEGSITMSTSKLTSGDTFSDFYSLGSDIVEIVPNVIREVRIITDCNSQPYICCNRSLENSGLDGVYQAIGSNNKPGDCYLFDSDLLNIDPEKKEQIKSVITETCLPLHSFDLFLTKEGKFGFFECCSQFGFEGIPTGVVQQLAQDFIGKLLVLTKC